MRPFRAGVRAVPLVAVCAVAVAVVALLSALLEAKPKLERAWMSSRRRPDRRPSGSWRR